MIYEYRAYHVMPGKMPALHERFSKVTVSLFKKHGMQVVGFWKTVIGESNELVYILAFEDLPTENKPGRHSLPIRNGRRQSGPARPTGRSSSGS